MLISKKVSLFFLSLLVCAFSLSAHQDHQTEADSSPKIAAWNNQYEIPGVGSYQLPKLGFAGDGEVLDTNQQSLRLHDLFSDRIVLLSFIYTSCSDPEGCPLASAVMLRIKQELDQNPSLNQQIRLLSLSFDPNRDTPTHLANYAKGFQTNGPGDWRFLTTQSNEQLDPILEAYQQSVLPDLDSNGNSSGNFSHILRVFLIDRQQRIRNIYSASFLNPDLLLTDLQTLLVPDNQQEPAITNQPHKHDGLAAAKTDQIHKEERTETAHSLNLLTFAQTTQLGLPPLKIPQDNPLTSEKIDLGKKLFFDRRLSLNDTFSCAMCHIPQQGFTSNEMATSVGVEGRTVRRNAPTILNVGNLDLLFHDGREELLEYQSWQPLLAKNEMANPSVSYVLNKLRRLPEYQASFEQAFPKQGIRMETVGMALASYQRVLQAGNSAFDRWYYLGQQDAISVEAQQGFALFQGKGGCASCHSIDKEWALFTDQQLHNTGIGYQNLQQSKLQKVQLAPGVEVEVSRELINQVSEPPPSDLGLYEITQNPADRWKYRTPSLRNVTLTAPYMHNGALQDLAAVIDFYDQGGISNPELSPLMRPLYLTAAEKQQLLSFLNTLTGADVDKLVDDAMKAPIGDHQVVYSANLSPNKH